MIAESGSTIKDVSDHLEQLKRLDPERVFLCFGINDIACGLWPEPADYAAECAAQIQAVAGALPETDRIMKDTFWLGVYPGMTKAMLDEMILRLHESISGTHMAR